MRRPPVKLTCPSIVVPAPIRLSMGLGLLVFPNMRSSLREIDGPGKFNLSSGNRKNADIHALEGGALRDTEAALHLVVEAELEAAGGFGQRGVREGHGAGRV